MHVAYSAFKTYNGVQEQTTPDNTEPEPVLRFRAYQTVCEKYSREIATIQQYLPGWVPPFYNP